MNSRTRYRKRCTDGLNTGHTLDGGYRTRLKPETTYYETKKSIEKKMNAWSVRGKRGTALTSSSAPFENDGNEDIAQQQKNAQLKQNSHDHLSSMIAGFFQ